VINVGTLSKLRRLVLRDKVSIRQASRQLGISRNTTIRPERPEEPERPDSGRSDTGLSDQGS
jgi:hypothetical protein